MDVWMYECMDVFPHLNNSKNALLMNFPTTKITSTSINRGRLKSKNETEYIRSGSVVNKLYYYLKSASKGCSCYFDHQNNQWLNLNSQ